MPITIYDILNKKEIIERTVTFWGGVNPRLFKGVIPEEENLLLLLFKKTENLSHTQLLEENLQEILACKVNVSEEEDLNEKYKEQVLKTAISLSDEQKLLQVFEGIAFTERPVLTEEQQQAQAYDRELYELIKKDRANKRNFNNQPYSFFKQSSELLEQDKSGKLLEAQPFKKPKVEELTAVIQEEISPEKKGEKVEELLKQLLDPRAMQALINKCLADPALKITFEVKVDVKPLEEKSLTLRF